jgi:protease I
MVTLQGQSIAFLLAPEGAEQIELTDPWQAVAAAGGTPPDGLHPGGRTQAFNLPGPGASPSRPQRASRSLTAFSTGPWVPGRP